MSTESQARQQQQHYAMPKLMGAPAYARPPRLVDETPRPFDPDDLPLEAERTPEEQAIVESVVAGFAAWASGHDGASADEAAVDGSEARARSFVARLGFRRG